MNQNQKIALNYKTSDYALEKGKCLKEETFVYNKESKTTISLFKDIEDFDKHLVLKYSALQTSTGLNHYRRDKFVIDIDRFRTIEEHLEDFYNNITKNFNIDWSGWIYNSKKGTIQFTIYLEECYNLNPYSITEEHEKYKINSKKLNSLAAGDLDFKGWQCKNVFYKDKNYISEVKNYKVKKEYIEKKLENVIIEEKKVSKYKKGTGKQKLELKYGNEFFNKNPECLKEDIGKYLISIKELIRIECNSEENHSDEELMLRGNAIWTFNKFKIKKYNIEKRKIIERRNIEITKWYKNEEFKQKEIASFLNLSLSQIKRYYFIINKEKNNKILTIDEIAWKFEYIE